MRLVGTIGRMRLVLLLVGAVIAGLAALAPAQAASNDVPITIRLSGMAAFTNRTTVEFNGGGEATHMGRVVNHGVALIGTPVPTCPGGVLGLPNVHTETITAANGDKLVLRMLNLACPTGENTYHGTGTWTVIDGSGRFEGTTGEGTCDGHADFAAQTFACTLTGVIRYA
jgi:hypothetical protein